MSRENVEETVHFIYDVWNEGGPEAAQANWAEDIEYHDPPNLPDAQILRGRERFKQRMYEFAETAGDLAFDVKAVRPAGDEVVVLGHMTVKGQASLVEVPGEIGHVVQLENRKLKRLRAFLSWQETLEAAGLRESGG